MIKVYAQRFLIFSNYTISDDIFHRVIIISMGEVIKHLMYLSKKILMNGIGNIKSEWNTFLYRIFITKRRKVCESDTC